MSEATDGISGSRAMTLLLLLANLAGLRVAEATVACRNEMSGWDLLLSCQVL